MAAPKKEAAKSATKGLGQLETVLEEYLVKKAPALPDNIRGILVTVAPYLAVVGVVMAVPGLLALLSARSYLGANYYWAVAGTNFGYHYYLTLIFTAASVVLQGLAIPGLFARTKKGWNLVFYSVLVSAVYSVLVSNWMGLVVGTLISLYLLFQVRSRYH